MKQLNLWALYGQNWGISSLNFSNIVGSRSQAKRRQASFDQVDIKGIPIVNKITAYDKAQLVDSNKFVQRPVLWQTLDVETETEAVGFETEARPRQYPPRLSEIFFPQLFRRQLLASGQDRQQTLHTCYFWQAASAGVHSTMPAHSKCAYAA